MESVRGQTPRRVKEYDVPARRIIDGELTSRVVDFMGRNAKANRLFFAYVPYTQVHIPTLPHPEFEGRTGNGNFADVLTEVDARAAGASMPTDRVIDGVDQFDFLTGKADHSSRDGFPVYNGDTLMAYKWGNWKLHFMEQATMGSPIVSPGMPRLYHLLRDPKEQYDLVHYGGEDGFWVMPAIMKRVVAHRMTLQEEPPIRIGTRDPYVPPRK